jgi:hypothetical protein
MLGKIVIVGTAILVNKWLGLVFFILFCLMVYSEKETLKSQEVGKEEKIPERTERPRRTPERIRTFKYYIIEDFGDKFRVIDQRTMQDLGYDFGSLKEVLELLN